LVELQHAAVAAVRAALDRAMGRSARSLLEARVAEQKQLLHAAEEVVRALGGAPPTAAESHAELPYSADAIVYLSGDDRLLLAIADNCEAVAKSAAQAVATVPESQRRSLEELTNRQLATAKLLRSQR
jgi:hypothetical protein